MVLCVFFRNNLYGWKRKDKPVEKWPKTRLWSNMDGDAQAGIPTKTAAGAACWRLWNDQRCAIFATQTTGRRAILRNVRMHTLWSTPQRISNVSDFGFWACHESFLSGGVLTPVGVDESIEASIKTRRDCTAASRAVRARKQLVFGKVSQ